MEREITWRRKQTECYSVIRLDEFFSASLVLGVDIDGSLGSVPVRCYGITKFLYLKTYGSHDKITIL
jgi:hypothetical protein